MSQKVNFGLCTGVFDAAWMSLSELFAMQQGVELLVQKTAKPAQALTQVRCPWKDLLIVNQPQPRGEAKKSAFDKECREKVRRQKSAQCRHRVRCSLVHPKLQLSVCTVKGRVGQAVGV